MQLPAGNGRFSEVEKRRNMGENTESTPILAGDAPVLEVFLDVNRLRFLPENGVF